jgi:hypothetical protein
MKIFVAWSVDQLEGITAAALMSGHVEELRRISSDIRRAGENIKAWAQAVGGSPILDLSVLGVVAVPTDRMTELPSVAQRYKDAAEAAISVGVGMSIDEAYVAMRHSQSAGGDKISLYDPKMEATTPEEPEEVDPMQALGKSELFTAHGEGFVDKQGNFYDREEALEVVAHLSKADGDTQPPAGSEMNASGSATPEQEADTGGQVPQDPNGGQVQPEQGEEQDPRTAVIQALQKIKSQSQVLEQMKQTNPQAFDAVKSVVAAMIIMAQGLAMEDDSSDGGESETRKSEKNDHEHGDWQKDGAGEYCGRCGGDRKICDSETMSKAGLPMPAKTPKRIKRDWPVGHVKEGSIKVAHVDPATNQVTGTSWHSVRAGMIQSEDGHPISSRNPNGK